MPSMDRYSSRLRHLPATPPSPTPLPCAPATSQRSHAREPPGAGPATWRRRSSTRPIHPRSSRHGRRVRNRPEGPPRRPTLHPAPASGAALRRPPGEVSESARLHGTHDRSLAPTLASVFLSHGYTSSSGYTIIAIFTELSEDMGKTKHQAIRSYVYWRPPGAAVSTLRWIRPSLARRVARLLQAVWLSPSVLARSAFVIEPASRIVSRVSTR